MNLAVSLYSANPKQTAIIGDPADAAQQALIATVYSDYMPNKIVVLSTPADAANPNAPPLLKGKTLIHNKPAAYVCQDYICKRPVTTTDELAKQLAD